MKNFGVQKDSISHFKIPLVIIQGEFTHKHGLLFKGIFTHFRFSCWLNQNQYQQGTSSPRKTNRQKDNAKVTLSSTSLF